MNTDAQKPDADAIQELADALEKRMSRPAHSADHTSFELSGLLNDMYSASPDDQPHARFLRLCHLVLEGFSDGDISAEAISKNPVTPQVMVYLLRALADYAKRDKRGACERATGRASELAEAMLLSGGGKQTVSTIWTDSLQSDVVSAGAAAYADVMHESEIKDDDAHARALKAGKAAAYQQARCKSDGALREFNSTERRAVRAKVTKLLAEHGYRSDWPDRRVKS